MTGEQRLYRRTLVPRELYIQRRADRQLEQVLDHMDQPAQVLVARQMGKTNLINNAIRSAEPNDLFVYVDLTNFQPDLRFLFRSIIDAAVKQLVAKNLELPSEVEHSRKSTGSLQPGQEHEIELLLLLKEIAGRFVLCLDEIDALNDFQDADRFFGFVRSTFFSRISNPDFHRLNYILAGVLEPIEIITRDDVSPFNIAKSIELDDFTLEQVLELSDRAKLNWPKNILERVYGFTRGHPRMTWEICSELEDLSMDLKRLSVSDVDSVVEGCYFEGVALPPIDGIQRQLDSDHELRFASAEMLEGRGGDLSARSKKKLYLAGLVAAPFRRAEKLKNVVIERVVAAQRRGKFDSSKDLFKQSIVSSSERVDERHIAQELVSRGSILQQQGDYVSAESAFHRALEINERIGDTEGVAVSLNNIGVALQRQGDLEQALRVFRRLLEVSSSEEASGDTYAIALERYGDILQQLGKFEEAERIFQDAVRLLSRNDDQLRLASLLNRVGSSQQSQGRLEEATGSYRKSLEIFSLCGEKTNSSLVLNNLGGLLQKQGRFEEALEAFRSSHELMLEQDDDRARSSSLSNIGGVLQRQGKLEEAAEVYLQSLRFAERVDDPRHLAFVMNSLGGILQKQGKFEEAVTLYKDAQSLLAEEGDYRGQAMVLNSLGGALQRLGKQDEAVNAFGSSVRLEELAGNEHGQAMAAISLGGALQRQSKFNEAKAVFESSLKLLVELDDQRGQVLVLNSLGSVMQRQGRFDEAIEVYERSYRLLEKLNDTKGQAIVLNSLGGVLQRVGRTKDSDRAFVSSIDIGASLGDDLHLARAHTAFGRALLDRGLQDRGIAELIKGFELDEGLRNRRGMKFVAQPLVEALRRTGRLEEAEAYIQRALDIAPGDEKLQRLSRSPGPIPDETRLVLGVVKRVLNPLGRSGYAFITPIDGGNDIYANEYRIGKDTFSKLTQGMAVELEVYETDHGTVAKSLRLRHD